MSFALNIHRTSTGAILVAATLLLNGCLSTPNGSAEFIVSSKGPSSELFSAALKACQDLDLPVNQSVKDAGLIQCGVTATQARLAPSSFSVNVLINRSGAQIKIRSRSGIYAGSTSNQEAQSFGEKYVIALQSNGQPGLKVKSEQGDPSDRSMEAKRDEEGTPTDRNSSRSTESTDEDKALILKGQQLLNQKGFNSGAPDGLMGPRTRKAVQDFQSKHNLPATGIFDVATMRLLQEQGPQNEVAIPAATKPSSPASQSKPSRSLSDL